MASQEYICNREEDIIFSKLRIMETLQALEIEIRQHEGIIPENVDFWGTLSINLDALSFRIVRLQTLLKKYIKTLT